MSNPNFDFDYYQYHLHRLISIRDANSPELNFLAKMFILVSEGRELYDNQARAVDRYIDSEPETD